MMLTGRTYEGECLPRISSQSNPLPREDEAQLEWLFCLASSLERIQRRLGAGSELKQAQVDAPVLLAHGPFLEPAAALFPAP